MIEISSSDTPSQGSLNDNTIMSREISEAKSGLLETKKKHPNCPVLAHININSIRNKIESLSFTIANNVDMLIISETKLDDSFPTSQFELNGFGTPYRYDKNSKGGGILLYVREDISSKLLKNSFETEIESISIELNLRKPTQKSHFSPSAMIESDH